MITRGISVSCLLVTLFSVICNAEIKDARQPGEKPKERPGRFLSLPVPKKCSERPKEFFFNGHNYFFSGHLPVFGTNKYDWLDARNACREYCMDLVSIETQEENNLIFKLIQQNDIPYIWTSGRLCDFKGCENRRDLEPKSVFGWFWSATRAKMSPTNQIPQGWGYNAWSQSGHKKVPQPDNAEYDINQTNESCVSVLNNVYKDGIAWHDVACYHEKPFVCEDSEELLTYVASTNPGIRL
uniref:C-type lectin domain-containing protein n=1 Tax=Cacopsylla melanoneura TaxID=428564 RepID=A0A8D8RAG7_9HEMI